MKYITYVILLAATSFGACQQVSESREEDDRYIDILQRQADGEWRVVWHTWAPVEP